MPTEEERKQTTVQLGINFTAEEAVVAVASQEQSHFLTKLYRSGHDSGPGPEIVMPIGRRVKYLKEKLGLNEETFEQIIVSDRPRQNIDEAEIWLLDRYKGALVRLSWAYLYQSNLPDELKAQFNQVESMKEFEIDDAMRKVSVWFDDHPEQNTPIQPNFTTVNRIERVYQRMRELVDFYNSKRIVPYLNIVKEEVINLSVYPELEPSFLVKDFYFLFCPTDEQFKQYADSMGWPVGPNAV